MPFREERLMTEGKRILVVGNDGRAHAFCEKLAQSPGIEALFCARGNGGIQEVAKCIDIAPSNIPALIDFARKESVDLVVVSSEIELANGIVDAFEAVGTDIPVFGPNQKASRIESSKAWAQNFMQDYGIPCALGRVFFTYRAAERYVYDLADPYYVIKADGLCAGKGAFVVLNSIRGNGLEILFDLMVRSRLGKSGEVVVVQEFLRGTEVSRMVFTDGESIIRLPDSQDHKTLWDGDQGPNTGGMGAYTPIPFVDADHSAYINEEIMLRTLCAMHEEGLHFKGGLYSGLMITERGPKVLEFNGRFGDPETQPVFFKMKSDPRPIVVACVNGNLKNEYPLEWKEGVSLTVVLASAGYPEKPDIGKLITGLEAFKGAEDVFVYHSGTRKTGGQYFTSGGRVLGVTVIADNHKEAMKKAYDAVTEIKFEGMQYRKDIGQKAVDYLNR